MLVRDCDSTYPRLSQIGLSGTVSTCTESPMARSCATALTRSAPTTSGMVTAGARPPLLLMGGHGGAITFRYEPRSRPCLPT